MIKKMIKMMIKMMNKMIYISENLKLVYNKINKNEVIIPIKTTIFKKMQKMLQLIQVQK